MHREIKPENIGAIVTNPNRLIELKDEHKSVIYGSDQVVPANVIIFWQFHQIMKMINNEELREYIATSTRTINRNNTYHKIYDKSGKKGKWGNITLMPHIISNVEKSDKTDISNYGIISIHGTGNVRNSFTPVDYSNKSLPSHTDFEESVLNKPIFEKYNS